MYDGILIDMRCVFRKYAATRYTPDTHDVHRFIARPVLNRVLNRNIFHLEIHRSGFEIMFLCRGKGLVKLDKPNEPGLKPNLFEIK